MIIQEHVAAYHAANPTANIYDAKAHAETLPEPLRGDFLKHWHKLRFGVWLWPKNREEMFPGMPPASGS